MSYIFFALLMVCTAHAALEKIHIKNLDLNYEYPYGSGVLEKLTLGVNTKTLATYPIEIFRRDKTFEITSPFVDFEWLDPIAFVHNLHSLNTQKLNLRLDYKESILNAETLKIASKAEKPFSLSQLALLCQGGSLKADPIDRLIDDCLTKTLATIDHMDLPFEIVKKISADFPDVDTEESLSMPATDFSLEINDGQLFSYVRIKVLFRAYLRFRGFVQTENEGKTIAVRVDSVKFGYLTVTNRVLGRLREIKHPAIKVDPPWIRIQVGE